MFCFVELCWGWGFKWCWVWGREDVVVGFVCCVFFVVCNKCIGGWSYYGKVFIKG